MKDFQDGPGGPLVSPVAGDYAILAAMQSFMPELGIERERTVFVSGNRLRGRALPVFT